MISSRRLFDIGLIAAALLLGGYLILTQGAPTTSELQSRKNNLLPAFLEDKVQEIKIRSPSTQAELILRRDLKSEDTRRYYLGKMGSHLADPASLAELLRTLSFASFERSWLRKADSEPRDFGFRKYQLEVRIEAGSRSYRILIGKKAPSPEGSLYVQVEGRSIETRTGVVDAKLLTDLSRGEQEFRGSLLFPYSRSRTSSLTISSNNEEIILQSDGLAFLVAGSTESSQPLRAERKLSDLIFFQLARAKIESFIDEEAVLLVLKEEAEASLIDLRMESPDGKSVEVGLGGMCPGDPSSVLAIRTAPDRISGCVTRSILAALRYSSHSLIDRSAVPLNADEIDHVVIRQEGKTLDLIRDDDHFRLASKANTSLSSQAARKFLELLTSAKLELLKGKPQSLSKVWGTLTVKGQSPASFDPKSRNNEASERTRELKVELFREESKESSLVIRRLDDDAWLRVPPTLNWAFSADAAWTRKRELSTWTEAQIESVGIRQADEQSGLTKVERIGKGFILKGEGPSKKADSTLSRLLLDELAHLKARRFLSPSPARPKKNLLMVEWRWRKSKNDEAHGERLWLGRRVRGGYLSWASFVEGAFVLPLGTKSLFETPLTDRLPVTLTPEELLEVELSFEKRSYRFVLQDGEFRAAGGIATFDMSSPVKDAIGGLQILSSVPEDHHDPATRVTKRLTLKGRRLTKDASSESFTLHFGQSLSWYGQAVALCWLDGSDTDYFVSELSLLALLEVL